MDPTHIIGHRLWGYSLKILGLKYYCSYHQFRFRKWPLISFFRVFFRFFHEIAKETIVSWSYNYSLISHNPLVTGAITPPQLASGHRTPEGLSWDLFFSAGNIWGFWWTPPSLKKKTWNLETHNTWPQKHGFWAGCVFEIVYVLTPFADPCSSPKVQSKSRFRFIFQRTV